MGKVEVFVGGGSEIQHVDCILSLCKHATDTPCQHGNFEDRDMVRKKGTYLADNPPEKEPAPQRGQHRRHAPSMGKVEVVVGGGSEIQHVTYINHCHHANVL